MGPPGPPGHAQEGGVSRCSSGFIAMDWIWRCGNTVFKSSLRTSGLNFQTTRQGFGYKSFIWEGIPGSTVRGAGKWKGEERWKRCTEGQVTTWTTGPPHRDSLGHVWGLPDSQPAPAPVPRGPGLLHGQGGLQQGDMGHSTPCVWTPCALSPIRETEAYREVAGCVCFSHFRKWSHSEHSVHVQVSS